MILFLCLYMRQNNKFFKQLKEEQQKENPGLYSPLKKKGEKK